MTNNEIYSNYNASLYGITPHSVRSCTEYELNKLNGIWVRALPGPMHLGLKTGPFAAE